VRAARRDSVLKAHGVTVRQLDSAARALARDPDRAEALLQAANRANGVSDSVRSRPGRTARRRKG